MTDSVEQTERPRAAPGVGGPAWRRLNRWGNDFYEAWGIMAYHVGSSTTSKEFHDVDVRVIMDDDLFFKVFGTVMGPLELIPRWRFICDALSAHASQETGLPMDVQIQPMGMANAKFGNRVRLALFYPTDLDKRSKWSVSEDGGSASGV